MLSQHTGKIYNFEENNECLMEVGKTGIKADHSNSTSSTTIFSSNACTLSLLDDVDKITKAKTGGCGSRVVLRGE